jgi:hypothetical protein
MTIYTPQESVLPSGTTDDQLIAMWLHDKSDATQEEYKHDIGVNTSNLAFCMLSRGRTRITVKTTHNTICSIYAEHHEPGNFRIYTYVVLSLIDCYTGFLILSMIFLIPSAMSKNASSWLYQLRLVTGFASVGKT